MFASHLLVLLAPLVASQTVPAQLYSNLIPQKVLATNKALPVPVEYPQYTDTQVGKWLYFIPDTWTSGFFPTTLYALNTRKNLCGATSANGLNAADWLTLGRSASNGLIPLELHNTQGHDVGFLSFPFVEELTINPTNKTALTAVKQFAGCVQNFPGLEVGIIHSAVADLAARFDPIVGCTRSWDTADPTDFTVIIDNMMNLEILWVAYGLTGNNTLRDIALAHADTTMKNHIRPDGSTWHVVEYNSTTGVVIRKRTQQGFSDNRSISHLTGLIFIALHELYSTWSRGQAWGLYGFANMYKHSKNVTYLQTATRLADYFLDNLPSDGIVPWDFNAPLTPPPRPADSSAATIAATGLLLMGTLDKTNSQKWINAAINLLSKITNLAWRPSWQSLLSNGTVNWPANNFLTGIVYGDYYYIKAGNDLITMGLAKCP
ncbi:Glycoside hydrolase family 88 protein [Mycena sanguinolenta]|uniref:Glycoside hydrolase family 88 protein n=1 Tax=Mycena sanguinolenta TaxID=230812 RepID=A0A8H6YDR2_9AGAR|nr:Glycoside hydrolase family 88 protein [Mycena sanguinolenta]